MAENPISAIKAILASPYAIDGRYVYPMTIARYALLDQIDSVFIKPKENIDPVQIIAGLYIMTADNDELRKAAGLDEDRLKARTLAWAIQKKIVKWLDKNMTTAAVRIMRQFKDIYYLVPDFTDDQARSRKPSNGWLAQMIYTAVKDFNIDVERAIYDIPLATLMLLLRQKLYNDSEGKAMTLQDKELIDRLEK